MAGRDKRRRAAPLEGDEQQLRRRLEEAALLLRRIKGLVRWIVEEVAAGRSPSIVLHRYRNYCSSADSASPSPWFSFRARSRDHLLPDQFTVTSLEQFSPKCVTSVDPGRALVRDCSACSYDIPVGTDVLSLLHKDYHTSRLNVLLRVLFVVQQLLQQNKHCSKRDIYYMYPSIFVEVAVVDRAINDICILFKCSRHNLNVVPVVKGLVMGWIRFMEGEKKVYCITSVNAAFSIPVDIEAIKDVVSVAHYILVVEKETVFQRLANDKFCERNRCIVITGRGYPDIPTRSNWHMMQTCCVSLIYGGLEFSHLILKNIAFQTAAYFVCHLKIGGKLKAFLLGAIYTGKPQNGGQSWKQCCKRVSSLRLRHYPQIPFPFYRMSTFPRKSNKLLPTTALAHSWSRRLERM
ncbi:meiotic recombination protein SPO11 isoform X5 [Zea mays]|uniref:meiotic recombination protein SPO11 isoform X5 n=1 Tax=Zea mays TaxID=4577 RepID=UPI0004DEC4C8|nr:meiotic recombination protein SPO11 isoform X5 [Zea mays]|eukprot:XP_008643456.1 meiotic recombination protein SPO11 isoform X5 [Zea mays]